MSWVIPLFSTNWSCSSKPSVLTPDKPVQNVPEPSGCHLASLLLAGCVHGDNVERLQAGMDREEMMGEMKKINEGQQEALKAILTPEQLEKYKTMQSQMRAGGPPRN